MKKALIIVSLTCCILSAKAQDFKKHELYLGIGYYCHDGFMVKGAMFIDNIFQQNYDIPKLKRLPDFHFSYKFRPVKRLVVGAIFTYSRFTGEVFQKTSLESMGTIKMGDLAYNYYTVAGEMDIYYVANPIFKFYGALGLGYTFGNIKYRTVGDELRKKASNHFNFQFSPIAFKVGGRAGGYLEIGYGYKGIFSGGAFFNF